MKTPRVNDFDPNATNTPKLGTPMDNLPAIKKPQNIESASLLANQQTSKEEKNQTNKLANQQTSKPILNFSTKEKKKYGTYLSEDSISEIQLHAVKTKRKDHEIVQEAIAEYFKRRKI